MPISDGGMTFYKNEEEHKLEIEELGLRFQYGCYMDKLPESCFSLGVWFQNYKENLTKAMEVFKFNCETYKHPESCMKHALGLFYGDGIDKNPLQAYETFKKNCLTNNHIKSCYAAGTIIADALVSHKPNFGEALSFFEKGCAADFPEACFRAGLIHVADNAEMRRDLEKSARFWTKACDLGHFEACVNVALMHRKGDFYEQSEDKFEELMEKADTMRREMPGGHFAPH